MKGKDLRKEGMLLNSIYEEWISMKGHCPSLLQDLLKRTDMPVVLNSFDPISLLRICLGELREELQSLSNVQESDKYNEPSLQQLYFLRENERNQMQNAPGRPRIQITQAQLEA